MGFKKSGKAAKPLGTRRTYIEDATKTIDNWSRTHVPALLDKLTKTQQLRKQVCQQTRYDADEMIRFSKVVAEQDGFELLADWLKRLANAQKQVSELQTTLNQVLGNGLSHVLEEFSKVTVPEVKATKKALDKSQASYESAQSKVAALKKKDKGGAKAEEVEAALESEKAVWVKLKQGSVQSLEEVFKKFHDKSCKSIFEAMRAYEVCYKEGARITSRFSQDVLAGEQALSGVEAKPKARITKGLSQTMPAAVHSKGRMRSQTTGEPMRKEKETGGDDIVREAESEESDETASEEAETVERESGGDSSGMRKSSTGRLELNPGKDRTTKALLSPRNLMKKSGAKKSVTSPKGERNSTSSSTSSRKSVKKKKSLGDDPASVVGGGEGAAAAARSASSPPTKARQLSRSMPSVSQLDEYNLDGLDDPGKAIVNIIAREEATFLQKLGALVKSYLPAFTNEPLKHKVPAAERNLIFCNVEGLLELNSSFYGKVTKCRDKWPEQSLVSILAPMVDELRLYVPYLSNYGAALACLEQATKKHKQIQPVLQQVKQDNKHDLPLQELLAAPLDIFTRFKRYLEHTIRYDLCSDEDVPRLEACFNRLQKYSEQVQLGKTEASNVSMLLDLQEKLTNYPDRLDSQPSRQLLCQWSAMVHAELPVNFEDSDDEGEATVQRSKQHVFLFTDLVLFTKMSAKLVKRDNMLVREKRYKVLNQALLHKCHLNDVPDCDAEKNCLQLIYAESKDEEAIFTMVFKNKDLKVTAAEELKRAIKDTDLNKVFGVPLEFLMTGREKGKFVPSLLTEVVRYIVSTGGLKQEGLIRVSGSSSTMHAIRDAVNQGERLVLDSVDPHTAVGLLKLFFRELPEPIMTYAAYPKFIQAHDMQGTVEERVAAYKAIVEGLPMYNKFALMHTLSFFALLASYSETNKMTAQNISLVMASIFLAKKGQEVFEKSTHTSSEILEFLIANYKEIFATVKLDLKQAEQRQMKGELLKKVAGGGAMVPASVAEFRDRRGPGRAKAAKELDEGKDLASASAPASAV